MSKWRSRFSAGVLAATLSWSGAALAQPSAADKVAAEALYDEGKRLLEAKRFEEACRRFEESQRLDAGVGTLLYLGACYEQLGRRASAWATFREASSTARASGDAERERIARERADKLEAGLFRLTLQVAPENRSVTGFSIKRGETEVSPGVFGVAVPVDSGSFVVRASAPGHQAWSTAVTIPEGAGEQTVVVPALVALETPPPPAPAPAPPPLLPPADAGPGAGPAPDAAEPSRTQLVAGVIVGSVGLVGLGIGGIAAAIAVGKDGDADAFCDGAVCRDPQGVELSESARSAGDVATVAMIAGGVALAAGIVLVLTAPSGGKPEGPALALGVGAVPSSAPAGALSLTGSFQ